MGLKDIRLYVDDRTAEGVFRVHRDVYSDPELFELEQKFYEADPPECPKCNGPMRVIALESRMHTSCGAFSSTWGSGRPSRPSKVRNSVLRVGPGTPICR